MKFTHTLALLFAGLSLLGCERPTPPAPVVVMVPGPAGSAGADGQKGETGKPGDNTTVVVLPPPASGPTQ